MAETSTDTTAAGLQTKAAAQLLRVHVPIAWPEGARCLNDGGPFPCATYGWAHAVLVGAGWHELQIKSLDTRTGPWS